MADMAVTTKAFLLSFTLLNTKGKLGSGADPKSDFYQISPVPHVT